MFTSRDNVKSYIDFFAVLKGLDDIRMVLNGPSCGLNAAIFASNFWLPMSATMTRLLSFGYRVVDIDIGEMCPNFTLHHSLRKYSGMDLTSLRGSLGNIIPPVLEKSRRLTATWSRLWFGLTSSPEDACNFYYLVEEFIRGNHKEIHNPLRWDSIILYLIGNKNYNPAYPSVYKWDERSKRITGDLIAYIDDLRAI